jgi:hypothetical protein
MQINPNSGKRYRQRGKYFTKSAKYVKNILNGKLAFILHGYKATQNIGR